MPNTQSLPIPPLDESKGTRSIERTVHILRELAVRGAVGWRIGDLAQHCELDRGTVHRILKCLVKQRLVQQRDSDKRYFVGPLAHELGLSVPGRAELTEAVHDATRQLLADLPPMTTVLCFLRSADESVCIARIGRTSQLNDASRIRVGQRRPLLSIASGMAIISALPAEEARITLAHARTRVAHLGADYLARAETLIRTAQQDGYMLSANTIWQGINLVAQPFGPPGAPAGALVVTASAADYSATEMKVMLPSIRRAAASLTAVLCNAWG